MVYVFYADRLYGEYTDNIPLITRQLPNEIYQGGYVYLATDRGMNTPGWYRCDFTPMLIEDVPKTLQALLLLLL